MGACGSIPDVEAMLVGLTSGRCCTMVGLVENALEEIKEKMNPDRIIIESRCVSRSLVTVSTKQED